MQVLSCRISCADLARKVLLTSVQLRTFTSEVNNPNRGIIEMLIAHKEHEEQQPKPTRNAFKVRAFQVAIDAIENLNQPIHSVEQVRDACHFGVLDATNSLTSVKLKGIGPGIAKRITLFLSGNDSASPKKLTEAEIMQKRRILEFQTVTGIGPVKAKALEEAGCKSIKDMHLSKYHNMLTHAQQIGLKYFTDLQQPLLRSEAETVLEFIRDHTSKFETILAGSYRRGSTSLSDIDVVLFHPNHVHIPTPNLPLPASEPNGKRVTTGRLRSVFQSKFTTVAERDQSILLKDVVQPLESRGLISATISSGARKWQGIVRVPQKDGGWEPEWQRKDGIARHLGKFRRMDLNLVPLKSRGAALLALTGDVQFNREIRTRALNLGLHLNEFGLWNWRECEANSDKRGHWELVKVETEEDVLAELGMEWIAPERRNFSFIVGKKANIKKTRPRKKESELEI